MTGLTVGVTFYLHDGDRSIWSNGGHQNCVFLVDLLRQCPGVDRVIPINIGKGTTAPKGMLFDGLDLDFKQFGEVATELDLLIECGSQIAPQHADIVHQQGGKVVCYKYGNALVLDAVKLCNEKHEQLIFNGTKFDGCWTNPQHVATNASYWEAIYRCPVTCLPHIWAPTFIDKAVAGLPPVFKWGYEPRPGPKSIGIFEPNTDVVKMAHIPMLVCDLVYREHPELIDTVWVTNTGHLREQLAFKSFCGQLDIDKGKAADGKRVLSCENRYQLVNFMIEHADVMVCHQWENALNYAYYEALYGHYPLVHNSPMLPEHVGHRYYGFDAHDGARALTEALSNHDKTADRYNAIADDFLDTVSPNDQANIDAHQTAIDELMAA